MNPTTRKRLGRVLKVSRPLSAAELAAAKRWFPNEPIVRLLEQRMRFGGRLCVVRGGRA